MAMKFITKHGKSEKDINSLRQEIAILKTLNHENIILMFDTFELEREFCVVTEYAQGELFEILQDDKRLPESTVQKVAKGLTRALYYLHSKRIIHRYEFISAYLSFYFYMSSNLPLFICLCDVGI